MAFAGDLVANLVLNSKKFGDGLVKARADLKAFVSSTTASLISLTGVASGALGLTASIQQARSQREEQRKLSAALLATGNAAGISATEIKRFADSRQDMTNFSNEVTLASASLLTGFKKVQGEAFTDTLRLAQDLAAMTGGALPESLKKVATAVNDPIAGIGGLTDVGVKFTSQQLEQIKALQESGQLYKAQAIVLRELEKTVGGVSEATADPLIQITNLASDIAANIGQLLLPSMRELYAGLNNGLGPLKANTKSFEYFGELIGRGVRFVMGWSKSIVAGAVTVSILTAGIISATTATKLWTASLLVLQAKTPIGWLSLAAGAAIYSASLVGLDYAASQIPFASAEAASSLERIGSNQQSIEKSNTALTGISRTLKEITDQRQAVDDLFRRFKLPQTELKEELKEINSLLRSHQITSDQASFLSRQSIDKNTGIYSQIKSVRDEIAILNGEATQTSIMLRDMLAAGAPPDAVEKLKELLELQEEAKLRQERIKEEREEHNRQVAALSDRKLKESEQRASRAEQLKETLLTPLDKLKRDLQELANLRKSGNLTQEEHKQLAENRKKEFLGQSQENEKTGPNTALEAGSAGALSLFAKAMSGEGTMSVQERSLRTQNRMEEHLRVLAERAERQQRLMDQMANKKSPTVVKMG